MKQVLCPALRWAFVSLASVTLLLSSAGCANGERSQLQRNPVTNDSKSASGRQSAPCTEYAKKICDGAGEETSTCASFKSAIQLMSEPTCLSGLKDANGSLSRLAELRRPCDTLREELCSALGPQTEICDFVRVQTRQFPVEQCEMMRQNQSQVLEDLKKIAASKRPLAPELFSAIARTDGPSFGSSDAKVDIVVFSDFECPFCSKAAKVVDNIRSRYGDRVHLVFRQYPLPIHANARAAAEASLAAHEQGKFWDFHDRVFRTQASLDRASLERHAAELGLDVQKFKRALDEQRFAARVDQDMELGRKVEVQGTPTVFVNGNRLEAPTDETSVVNAIERAFTQDARG